MLIFLKRFLTAFFVRGIALPLWLLLRFVFYKILVKSYKYYLTFLSRMGWTGFRNSSFFFFVRQKAAHAVVVVLVIILVFVNLTNRARAGFGADTAGKTILSGLVAGEFDSSDGGQLIEDTADVAADLAPGQQSYLDNIPAADNQPAADIAPSETGNSSILGQEGGVSAGPDLASPEESTNEAKPERTETVQYTVQPGDTISSIAGEFGVSINTILWENNLTPTSTIRPGDTLAILPVSGVTYTVSRGDTLASIAQKYNTNIDQIAEANKIADTDSLSAGEKLIIPGGRKTSADNSGSQSGASSNSSNNQESSNNGNENNGNESPAPKSGLEMIKDLIKPPAEKVESGGKMAWPTVGYRITQYYSWRHRAIDIANKIGTPIYAAADGVVVVAGWGTGYGNHIDIDHGGGLKTRYAHMSKFYVGVGDHVKKGEVIGAMGSTGWSTGPHVHFEVMVGSEKYNPLNYLR